jgi:hypothetical protein
VRDDIPVMLEEEARPLSDEELGSAGGPSGGRSGGR